MVVSRGMFHLGCGIFYIYGTYYDMQIVTEHILSYGGRLKYLTFLNLVSYLVMRGVNRGMQIRRSVPFFRQIRQSANVFVQIRNRIV